MFNVSHIHPMLVHFPIALALLGCLLEGISLYRNKPGNCGIVILFFATVSALLAAAAGGMFTPNFTAPVLAAAKNVHSSFAGFTVTALCVASAFYAGRYFLTKYSSKMRIAGYVFYVLSAVLVGITGFLGGALVYNDLLHM